MTRIESEAFTGGNAANYRRARAQLRERIAAELGVRASRIRLAGAAVTLEQASGDQWLPLSRDVIDQHEWYVRHSPTKRFRLTMRIQPRQRDDRSSAQTE